VPFHISVSEMAGTVLPPLAPKGFLLVIRGYFDESYKDKRVYAIAGYIGRDRDWKPASRRWKNRRLQDRIQCFHAADCEDGRQEFRHLSKGQCTQLKADLIQIVHEHENLGGFGAAVIIEDLHKVRESSERAEQVLGPDPYFLCFHMVLSSICKEFEENNAGPGTKVALVFEEQEQVSGRAKRSPLFQVRVPLGFPCHLSPSRNRDQRRHGHGSLQTRRRPLLL
jgi:hypothetical protein